MDRDDMYDRIFSGAEELPEEFFPNIDKVIASKEFPSVIRQLFVELKQTNYVQPGRWLKELNDDDLDILVRMSNEMSDQEISQERRDDAVRSYIILSIGLAMGEGSVSLVAEKITELISATSVFVNMESLYRKNLIEFNHDAVTFVHDENDKTIIAKAKGF